MKCAGGQRDETGCSTMIDTCPRAPIDGVWQLGIELYQQLNLLTYSLLNMLKKDWRTGQESTSSPLLRDTK